MKKDPLIEEAKTLAAEKLGSALAGAILESAERNGRISGLSAEETAKLKGLTKALIEGMHMSIILNAELNELPLQVAFVTVVESIAAWDREINKLAGRFEFGRS